MTTPRTHTLEARSRAMKAAGIDPNRVPEHVAIIMDGNGRWAKRRGEQRVFGHAHYPTTQVRQQVTQRIASPSEPLRL